MEMGVVIAAFLLLMVVGFLRFSGKKNLEQKLGLTVELARVAIPATQATQATWISDFGADCVNNLLLETAELDSELCAHLDTIEFDDSRQFLRLSEDYGERPLRKVIKYRCHLAHESESFYRCRPVPSRGDPPHFQPPRARHQWLYTVIRPQHAQNPDIVGIHSNVVPWQAYLKRLQGMIATCFGHESCTRGFSPISVLREGKPYHHTSCTNCALGDQLKLGASHVDAEPADLWDVTEGDVEHLVELGKGSEGIVHKIYWRKGVFAKKGFFAKRNFDREFEVATMVLHPNIVHCFGVSKWSYADENSPFSLYMELLEESLESRIQEPIQDVWPISFQDIVSVLWQVADAMRELHEKRFIHGDLKPDNILLSRLEMPHSKSGKFYLVKVADFGCAQRVPLEGFADPKSAVGKSKSAVLFNSKIGTTNYTAPEVFQHRCDQIPPKHPEKIDVYSFGVVAYRMLSGVTKLYEDYSGHPTKLKSGVIAGTLRPSEKFDTGTFKTSDHKSLFESLVVKCWDPNPECRPSFTDICDDLETLSSKHGENGAHGHWINFSAVMTFLKRQIAKRKDKCE